MRTFGRHQAGLLVGLMLSPGAMAQVNFACHSEPPIPGEYNCQPPPLLPRKPRLPSPCGVTGRDGSARNERGGSRPCGATKAKAPGRTRSPLPPKVEIEQIIFNREAVKDRFSDTDYKGVCIYLGAKIGPSTKYAGYHWIQRIATEDHVKPQGTLLARLVETFANAWRGLARFLGFSAEKSATEKADEHCPYDNFIDPCVAGDPWHTKPGSSKFYRPEAADKQYRNYLGFDYVFRDIPTRLPPKFRFAATLELVGQHKADTGYDVLRGVRWGMSAEDGEFHLQAPTAGG